MGSCLWTRIRQIGYATYMIGPSIDKRIIATSALMLWVVCGLFAQTSDQLLPCASPPVKFSWLEQFQQRRQQPELRAAGYFVGMSIHLVSTNEGNGQLSLNNFLDALCNLNEKFLPSKIQFFVKGDLHFIRDSRLAGHTRMDQIPEIIQSHLQPGTVNVFFVEDAMDACGYNLYKNGESIAIVMSNACVNGLESNWAHEMGHYLSLPHTFYGWERMQADFTQPAPHRTNMDVAVEMADKRNCSQAGDGFCDTPADYLMGRWACDHNGQSLVQQFDPSGAPFNSDGSLLPQSLFGGTKDRHEKLFG
jgi:hypothetical protein